MRTPKELAQAYVETINGPANGWGQHVHQILGRSEFILLRLVREVGQEECDRLVNKAFAEFHHTVST